MDPGTTGDEPHYLVTADSLAFDFDLDLTNNYTPEVAGKYWAPTFLQPDGHAFPSPKDGRLISVHYIGLPLLMAPILLLSHSLLAVRIELIIIAALLAQQTFRLLEDVQLVGPILLWLIWASIALCLPLVIYSNQVYPEVPAALITVYLVRASIAQRPTRAMLFLAGCGAAFLPWLHLRFSVIAAGAVFVILVQLLRLGTPRLVALVLTPCIAGGLLYLIVDYLVHGKVLSIGTYSVVFDRAGGWTLVSMYGNGIGAVLSSTYGWLPHSPAHIFGFVGLIPLVSHFGLRVLPAFGVLLAYFFLAGGPINQGASFPARILVASVPLVGIPMALVLGRSRAARVLFLPLFVLSCAIAISGALNHNLLYPNWSGRTRLPVMQEVQEAWPGIGAGSPGWLVHPEHTSREVGRLVRGEKSMVYAVSSQDPPGTLWLGPHGLGLMNGGYAARFEMAARGARDPASVVANLEVLAPPSNILARQAVRAADLPTDGSFATIQLTFGTTGEPQVQTRVHYTGESELWTRLVFVGRTSVPARLDRDFPSWPKTALWIVGILFVGALLANSPPHGRARRPWLNLSR